MDLQQENHALKMRITTMKHMEKEYEEEIEELKKINSNLTLQLNQLRTIAEQKRSFDASVDNGESSTDRDYIINQLQSELESRKRMMSGLESENRNLRERIELLEISVDNTALNVSGDCTFNKLLAEVDTLKVRLDAEKSEKEKLLILYREKDDDFIAAQCHVNEYQVTVKSLREQLSDLSAELEVLKLQAGSVENTRGNCLFAEVEDRRRRAEKLANKQQTVIDDLKQEMSSMKSRYRQTILQLQRELELSFGTKNSDLLVHLSSEVDRLNGEVSRLEAINEAHKEQKLNVLREADKMSAAFRPDNSNHHKLVKALEQSLIDQKDAVFKLKHELRTLRQSFTNEMRKRQELKRELTQQRLLVQRYSSELLMAKVGADKRLIDKAGDEYEPNEEDSIASQIGNVEISPVKNDHSLPEKVECKQS